MKATRRAWKSTLTPIYKVIFVARAQKAFDRLDPSLQRQLARKLAERRINPRVPADKLRKMPDCYKIKLRASGIRLVYQVRDFALILLVIGVGKREGEEAYGLAATELVKLDD